SSLVAHARQGTGDPRASARGAPASFPRASTPGRGHLRDRYDLKARYNTLMAVLSVRRYGDPILRQKADPVAEVTPEVQRIIADMVETMYHQVGIGLAAPQVGVSIRLILVDDGSRGPRALINPTIVERRGASPGGGRGLALPG